jgi:hypothetical protein
MTPVVAGVSFRLPARVDHPSPWHALTIRSLGDRFRSGRGKQAFTNSVVNARLVRALVSVMPRRSWSRFADLEFLDDPIEEVVGAWSRRQAISMDERFCEAMERALAAERGEPEAEAEPSQLPAVHASVE